jgi:hypothetical protein
MPRRICVCAAGHTVAEQRCMNIAQSPWAKAHQFIAMKTREIHRVGRFWFATNRRADGQWVAWAQTTPIYSAHPPAESKDQIWLAVGFSREHAAAQLKRQLALPPYDTASIQQRTHCWHMLLTAAGMLVTGVLTTEPALVVGGLIGMGHGLYRCAILADQADSRFT